MLVTAMGGRFSIADASSVNRVRSYTGIRRLPRSSDGVDTLSSCRCLFSLARDVVYSRVACQLARA